MQKVKSVLFSAYFISALVAGIYLVINENYWTGFSLKSILTSAIIIILMLVLPAIVSAISGAIATGVTRSETFGKIVMMLFIITFTLGMPVYVFLQMSGIEFQEGTIGMSGVISYFNESI